MIKKYKRILFCAIFLSLISASWPFSWLFSHPNPEVFGTRSWIKKEFDIIHSLAPNLDAKVLNLSLTAYVRARQEGYDTKQLLTIIDYSKPSSEKRLWVFDIKKGRVLLNTWVSHGKNSGYASSNSFSNSNGSLKSSIGVFVTDKPYYGGHGISLRMKGLERGVNDNAYDRNIVFHGAAYVSGSAARSRGQVGRSWGCPAVSMDTIKSLVDTIKENTVVFAYYPDRNWLRNSKYVA
jgi:L,D-transpeptidase catalytic domain